MAAVMPPGTIEMPRKLPPHVDRFRDRHGTLRLYFRRGKGPRVALPGEVGSAEFDAAYAAALVGEVVERRAKVEAVKEGTFEALIRSYLGSADFRGLRETTKAGYRSRLEAIRLAHGHRTVKGMTREGIVMKVLAPYADRPGAALDTLKKVRILIQHAMLLNWIQHDPSVGIKRPKNGEIRSWTDEELAQFEAKWQVGTKQRLAFALMLYTGQRRSDVHRMTWADVKDGTIRLTQQKTRAKLVVPLHSALQAILASAPREHVAILVTEYGKAFTVDGFSGFMRDAISAAGLPLEAQPHGLRKAAGRRLAEAGATTRQIMAVLGHKTLSEAERYTKVAEQAALAAGAIVMLEGRARAQIPTRA